MKQLVKHCYSDKKFEEFKQKIPKDDKLYDYAINFNATISKFQQIVLQKLYQPKGNFAIKAEESFKSTIDLYENFA